MPDVYRCDGCGVEKAANLFYRNVDGGVLMPCRKCRRRHVPEWGIQVPADKDPVPKRADVPDRKECSGCGTTKPADAYYRYADGRLMTPCKECRLAHIKKRYARDPMMRARAATYRKENAERIREQHRLRYRKNRNKHAPDAQVEMEISQDPQPGEVIRCERCGIGWPPEGYYYYRDGSRRKPCKACQCASVAARWQKKKKRADGDV